MSETAVAETTTPQPEIQEVPTPEAVPKAKETPAATVEEDKAKKVTEEKTEEKTVEKKEVKEDDKKEETEEKKEYVPQLKESGTLYKYKNHTLVGGYRAPMAWHRRFFKIGGQADKCEPQKLNDYYKRNNVIIKKPSVAPKGDAPKEGEQEAPQEGKDAESAAADNQSYLHSTIAHASQTGEGLLFYYKTEKATDRVYGLINLAEVDVESVSITTEVNKNHAFKLKVPKASREFFFYTETENDLKDWVHTIKHHVQNAKNTYKSLQDSTEYKEAYDKLVGGHYFATGIAEAASDPEPLSSEDDRAADSPKPVTPEKRKSYFTTFGSFLKSSPTSEPEQKETAEPGKADATGTASEDAAGASGTGDDKKPKPEKKPSLLSNLPTLPTLGLFGSKKESEEKGEGEGASETKQEEKKEAEKKEAEKNEAETKQAETKQAETKQAETKQAETKQEEKKEGEKKAAEEPGLLRKLTQNWSRKKTDEKKPETKAETEPTDAAVQPADGAKSTETDKKPEESTEATSASATDAAGPAAEKTAEKTEEKPTHAQEGSSSDDKKGSKIFRRFSSFPSKKTAKAQPAPLGETQEEQKPEETVKATAADAAEPSPPAQPSEAEIKIKEEASKARHSGHLQKRKQYMPTHEDRYVIFKQDGSIDYYESESAGNAPKTIKVTKKCAVRKSGDKNFELEVHSRTHRFTASTADECQKWVDEITKYLDSLPEEEKDKDGEKQDREVSAAVNGEQESFDALVQAAGDLAADEAEAAKAEAAKTEAATTEAVKTDVSKAATTEAKVVSEVSETTAAASTSNAAATSTDGETATTTTKKTETTQTSDGGHTTVTTTTTTVETTKEVTSSA